jgi:muramoyltetrapeptide carboxypeptidase
MTTSKNSVKSQPKAGGLLNPLMDPNSIYLFSPSGAVRDIARFEKSIATLKANGFSVEIDRGALSTSQRFAGTDKQRLAAFDRAAKSSANIVMTTRGGYGITRLLPQLDYKTLAQSKKRWVGFSDFTAFQLAMLAKAKAITYSGPAAIDVFGADEADDLTVSMFGEGIRNELELVGFASKTPATYKGFEAEGVLWGGNLSVLCSLQGSDYFPKVRGGLLMLEDVAEAPYKIERFLSQLLHSGVIDNQKAVLLGYFNQYKVTPHDDGFDMPAVVKWLRSKTKTPIITGLPMGHAPLKFTLPHGAKIGLAIDGGTCYLLLH